MRFHDALAPQGEVEQFEYLLDWSKIAVAQQLSRNRLNEATDVQTEVIREADGMLIKMQNYVLTHRLLSETEVVPCHVQVPWTATVAVQGPRRWWHKLFRRAPTMAWHDINGVVDAWGQVEVHLGHLATFPRQTMAYPDHMGTPVKVSQMSIGGEPLFQSRQTRAKHASATEAHE